LIRADPIGVKKPVGAQDSDRKMKDKYDIIFFIPLILIFL
jgi:hypothetical protein